MPVGFSWFIFQYLKHLVEIGNAKLVENTKRVDRYVSSVHVT